MGLVTDVPWQCPKCGHKNTWQLFHHFLDPDEIDYKEMPIVRLGDFKWTPDCEGCGKTYLGVEQDTIEMKIMEYENNE